MKNKHECYCILDSDHGFTPVAYHACCDIARVINDDNFEYIGAGVITRVSGRLQSGKTRKNFYVRKVK